MQDVADKAEKQIASLGCADASVELRHGDPGPVLVRAGSDAAVVVVGAVGHGPVGGALVGSVSRYLAVHQTRPLVVVRPTASESDRMVVGLDVCPSGVPALELAQRRAELTGAPVHAVHVVHAPDPFGAEPAAEADDRLLPRALYDVVDAARRAHPDVRLTVGVVAGRPARALVAAGADCALLVLGARGRHPFSRPLLASVGQQVLHHAPCPVAIVR
jgi:nucleotide-binding universal stress UspA family protein